MKYAFLIAAMLLIANSVMASDIPVMTIAYEARGEGLAGQIAVAEVIRNRVRERGQTAERVCLAKYQFSCWNAAIKPKLRAITAQEYQIAAKAWQASEASNLTRGATLYCNLAIVRPKWANRATRLVKLGRHTFFREK